MVSIEVLHKYCRETYTGPQSDAGLPPGAPCRRQLRIGISDNVIREPFHGRNGMTASSSGEGRIGDDIRKS